VKQRIHRWWHHYQHNLRPIWVAAQGTGRPERTIRTWAARGRVTSACDLRTRELLVDIVQVAKLANATLARREELEHQAELSHD